MNLKGKTIISTRPKGKSESIKKAVEAYGGNVLELPMIKIEPTPLSEQIKEVLLQLDNFDWIIFTSPNGIHNFFEKLKQIRGSYEIAPRVRFSAIGVKTAEILESYGVYADYINTGNTGKAFAEEMFAICNIGEKVLLPTGNLAKDTFKNILEGKTEFTRINVYNTTKPEHIDEKILDLVYNDQYELIIFTSPSGIKHFLEVTEGNIAPEQLKIASIGQTTTNAIKKYGIHPITTASMSNADGIIEAIINIV